jgi:hypothetical protein
MAEQHFIRVEVHEKNKGCVGVLDDAYNIKYDQEINKIARFTLTIPENSFKKSMITTSHELWVWGRDGRFINAYLINGIERKRTGQTIEMNITASQEKDGTR